VNTVVQPETGLHLLQLLHARLEQAEPHEAGVGPFAGSRSPIELHRPIVLPPAVAVVGAIDDHWFLLQSCEPVRRRF